MIEGEGEEKKVEVGPSFYGGETALVERMEKVERWFLSKNANLVSVMVGGKGQTVRVVMRRSVVHPRAEDEVVELPMLFKFLYRAGVEDGVQSVQMQVKRALGV